METKRKDEKDMSVYGAMDISASGMTAQQLRTDIISQNIANVNTTRDGNGFLMTQMELCFFRDSLCVFIRNSLLGGIFYGFVKCI